LLHGFEGTESKAVTKLPLEINFFHNSAEIDGRDTLKAPALLNKIELGNGTLAEREHEIPTAHNASPKWMAH